MRECLVSDLANLNPPLSRVPTDQTIVSFISMGDVSESGSVVQHSEEPFGRVKTGFTRFQNGDILFAKITPCMENGKGALVSDLPSGVGCGSTEFHVLRAKDTCCAAFLFQHLQSRALRQKAELYMSGSAGQQRVPTEFFRRLRISAPRFALQEKIAAILTSLDVAIENTEALIEKHQQIKAGLMHDLYSRGVLPTGELRPSFNGARELFINSEIGLIPQGWALRPAGQVCLLITKGTTPPSDEMFEAGEGVRFLRVDNLTFDGDIDFEASTFRVARTIHHTTLARSRCIPGDVLTNIVGPPLGKLGLVRHTHGDEVNINQAIAVFRPGQSILPEYLLGWLSSEMAKRWLLIRAKQTSGQVNFTLAMCQTLPVPVPPLEEQRLIVQRQQHAGDVVEGEAAALRKLRLQRLGLMQSLLTGALPVKATSADVAMVDA